MNFVKLPQIKYMLIGMLIVPCFGRIALNGTGHEDEIYRYLAPFLIGGIAGYLLGLIKQKWIDETDKLIKNIIDISPTIIYKIDNNGITTYVNSVIKKISGYNIDEIIGNNWWNLFYPGTEYKQVEKLFEKFSENEVSDYEMPLTCKNGEQKDISWNILIERDKNNRIIEITGFGVDISEHKSAKKELYKSEECYRITAEQTGQMIYDYNPKTGYIRWLGAINEITGYSLDAFSNIDVTKWAEMIHPEDRQEMLRILSEKQKQCGRYDVTYRFQRFDEKYIHIEEHGVFLPDEHGNAYRMLGTMTDISHRKTSEKELAKAHQQLQIVFDHSYQISIIATDANGKISVFNAGAERMLGYTAKEMIGKQTPMHIHLESEMISRSKELSKTYKNPIDGFDVLIACTQRGGHEERDWTYVKKDGSHITVNLNVTAVKNSKGEITGYVGFAQDITERKKFELTIKQNEAHLRTLIQTIPDLVWLKNTEGVYLACNHKFERFFGAKEADIVGNTDYNFVNKELADFFREKDNVAMAAGIPTINEEEVTYADDGHKELLETIKMPMLDSTDHLIGVLGIARDITERKKTEIKLKESESKYRNLYEGSMNGYVEVSLHGNILEANNPYRDMLGYSADELKELTYIDITPKKWHQMEKHIIEQQVISRGYSDLYEKEYIKKDGTLFPVELRAYLIKDHTEKPSGIWAFVSDITERKQAEINLELSEKKFRTLFNSSPLPMLITRLEDGKYIDVNQAAIDLFGFTYEEFTTPSTTELNIYKNPDDRTGLINTLNSKGDITHFEFDAKTKCNEVKQVEFIASVIELLGEKVIIGSIRDLTEYKKMERQLRQSQKMESIGTLAGGIAHDFNNILAAIIGYADIANRSLDRKDNLLLYINQVKQAGLRAKELVTQIQTFSRQSKPELKPTNIQSVIQEVMQLLRSSIPSTIEIKQSLNQECKPVLADPTQVHQVVMNLCTNAYHAMRETGGVLEISLKPVELNSADIFEHINLKPGLYLKLEIKDNGSGIEHKYIDRIFEPYFTTKEKGEGTGLGLAVVHSIIHDFHGSITAKSAIGVGTTFKILLPTIPEITHASDESRVTQIPKGTERILLIDDDTTLSQMYKLILEDLGYSVKAHASSIDALEAFNKNPDDYDLILTDMTMPKMTGFELARKVRSVNSEIPIILCSGYSDLYNEEKAKDVKINFFLHKPVNIEKIAITVSKALNNH